MKPLVRNLPKMKSVPLLTEKQTGQLARWLQRTAEAKCRKTGLPWVTLKFAQSLDGKIATIDGDSKWISSPPSLRFAHRLRTLHDAVMVGVNTVIRDDPRLTVRLVRGKNPLRIVVDSRLRIPLGGRPLRGKSASSTIVATTPLAEKRKANRIESSGAEVWRVRKDSSNRVELQDLLRKLGQADISSVLVEGGSQLLTSFLREQLADYLVIVVAPKMIGKGIASPKLTAPRRLASLTSLASLSYFRSGDDIILTARVAKS